jgi:hypothetical protein
MRCGQDEVDARRTAQAICRYGQAGQRRRRPSWPQPEGTGRSGRISLSVAPDMESTCRRDPRTASHLASVAHVSRVEIGSIPKKRAPRLGGEKMPADASLRFHCPPLLAKSGGCGTHLPLPCLGECCGRFRRRTEHGHSGSTVLAETPNFAVLLGVSQGPQGPGPLLIRISRRLIHPLRHRSRITDHRSRIHPSAVSRHAFRLSASASLPAPRTASWHPPRT